MNGGCPQGNLSSAFLERPEQFQFYSNITVNEISAVAPPLVTSSVTTFDFSSVTVNGRICNATRSNQSNAIISSGLSIALIVSLCITLGIWLGYRFVKSRNKGSCLNRKWYAFGYQLVYREKVVNILFRLLMPIEIENSGNNPFILVLGSNIRLSNFMTPPDSARKLCTFSYLPRSSYLVFWDFSRSCGLVIQSTRPGRAL